MLRTPGHRFSGRLVVLLLPLAVACACGDNDGVAPPAAPTASAVVRAALARFTPAAAFGHRGNGINLTGRTLPENSIAAFLGGLGRGADAVELDVELTADGKLVVMHDDTLDRTTTCRGCVSAQPLAAVQACNLLSGDMQITTERPPTLAQVFAALPPATLVSIELKAFEDPCRTATTGAAALAAAGISEVERLGVADRVLWSSFDVDVVAALKESRPDFYVGLLFSTDAEANVATAAQLGLDAVLPEYGLIGAVAPEAQARGMQVIVWTVNGRARMHRCLDLGVTAIISDEAAMLREVLTERGGRSEVGAMRKGAK
ncbi:glycerophosphodiester phosphodiesterase [Candidatus Binatia bacterium]|nr:glycerophosphodiester phosphodiesterase [Candidatus Binatia bacterium]